MTTTTDALGRYLFEGLLPGNYLVHVLSSDVFNDGCTFGIDVERGRGIER